MSRLRPIWLSAPLHRLYNDVFRPLRMSRSAESNKRTGRVGSLGSRAVSVMLDSGAEGTGFKSQSRRCRVTVLGKLFTHRAAVHQAAKLVAALSRVARVTAGLEESNGQPTAGFVTHVTSRLTAKTRDQLQNPTLGNRVCAIFTFKQDIYRNAQCFILDAIVISSITCIVFFSTAKQSRLSSPFRL